MTGFRLAANVSTPVCVPPLQSTLDTPAAAFCGPLALELFAEPLLERAPTRIELVGRHRVREGPRRLVLRRSTAPLNVLQRSRRNRIERRSRSIGSGVDYGDLPVQPEDFPFARSFALPLLQLHSRVKYCISTWS